MTSFRFRDPQLARLAAVAAQLGATMHADDGECSECDEQDFAAQHFGSTSAGTTDKPWNGAAARFNDDQYKRACAACDPGTGTSDGPTVKSGCFLPHHEPDGTANVNGIHAAAQRASSLKGHDSGAVDKAKAHLRSHYSKLKEDPPDSIAASAEAQETFERLMAEIAQALEVEAGGKATLEEMFGNLHEKFSGSHTHTHAAYGSQGGDQTHEHMHSHDGDNLHRHEHSTGASTEGVPVQAAGRQALTASFMRPTPTEAEGWWESTLAGLAFVAGAQPGQVDPMLGSSWAVKQSGDRWHVLTADGTWGNPVGTYAEALGVIAQQLAEQADSRPVLPQQWKSEMAYEGVSTGDGRFIEPGAIQYRNCPLPLMLQTETEPGHMGAVLAGAIMQTGKIGQVAVGAGDYDATDAGRQALQIIQARGRFGVSIDVAEAEGQPICAQHGTDIDQCDFECDWELHFSLIRVMGLTMTPFPAFEDAYIELATQPDTGQAQAASGAPSAWDYAKGGSLPTGVESATAAAKGLDALTAAGRQAQAKTDPPAAYFEPPEDWAGRLIRQPSGGYACPLTVEPPDANGWRRVYGHVADRLTCHTGIPDRCQRAPMTRDGKYPGFNLRPMMTAEGDLVKVGHISMGVGHASTTMRLTPEQVRAHYDGGPGALSMAWTAAGQDDHGPWIAGVINPERTEDEIEQFAMCSLSGDWRREWPQRGYDLFAVLAGVFVPGFPIAASALVAAGLNVPTTPHIPTEPCFEMDDTGEPLALVAMGVVRQPMPWEREMAQLRADREQLAARMEAAERLLSPLRPLAAQVLTTRLEGQDPLELMFAAPTAQDAAVTSLVLKAVQAVHAALAAQAQDPDNGKDPDDAAVAAHLAQAKAALDAASAAQAKDAAEPASA